MRFLITLAILFIACGDDSSLEVDAGTPDVSTADADAAVGLPLLGNGTHDIGSVTITVIATIDDAISEPRDLAFNPEAPTQLWIANQTTSVTILSDVGTPAQDWRRRNAAGSRHFLSRPAALAFGTPGNMATAPETDEETQEGFSPMFMGPTLWATDLDLFDGGASSHTDMLHNSPNSVGIAWETGNAYWVFDGMHQSLTRYDFRVDHGPGNADHSDGIVERHVEGQVAYVPDVSSHMQVFEGVLYVADTGNNRIARMNIATGTPGSAIDPNFDGTVQRMMTESVIETLVDGAAVDGFERPSGLEIRDGLIYVSDNATSRVFAFDMSGALIDWVDLSAMLPGGSMMGIGFDPNGDLYLTDTPGSRILRLAPR